VSLLDLWASVLPPLGVVVCRSSSLGERDDDCAVFSRSAVYSDTPVGGSHDLLLSTLAPLNESGTLRILGFEPCRLLSLVALCFLTENGYLFCDLLGVSFALGMLVL
jgi:hypothetical protein